jgi:hypothetical protein
MLRQRQTQFALLKPQQYYCSVFPGLLRRAQTERKIYNAQGERR